MPTLPLFQTPPSPLGWHQVIAPGGYEGWYYKFQNNESGIVISGLIGEGCEFGGAYRRAYQRYCRRPTRSAPPLPADYPCFQCVAYRTGDTPIAVLAPPTNERVRARTDRLCVSLGQHRLAQELDAIHL